MGDQKKSEQVDPAKVKVNDIMAFVYYGKVINVLNGGGDLQVQRLDGDRQLFEVRGAALVRSSLSADWYDEERRITTTEAQEIFATAYGNPFTVAFMKQDGTPRILRGRLIDSDSWDGRSMVEDLDITDGNRIRQVDHRTITWLILDGIKYVISRK